MDTGVSSKETKELPRSAPKAEPCRATCVPTCPETGVMPEIFGKGGMADRVR